MADSKTGDEGASEYSPRWWAAEVEAVEKYLKKEWWDDAEDANRRYLDKRGEQASGSISDDRRRKYNIFWANVQIIKSALYATPPKPAIKRQHDDAKDDAARVAALILERIINFGMDKDNSDLHAAIDKSVESLLIPGLGQTWMNYVPEVREIPGVKLDDGTPAMEIIDETAPAEHVNWKDFLFSTSRTWDEVWWVGRRIWMKEKRFVKKFGETVYKELKDKFEQAKSRDSSLPKGFTKGRIEVIEIWCEATNKVYWINRHHDAFLQQPKDDPLKLDSFWPCPRPLLATHTTDEFIPRTDYRMVQDQYEELDDLNDRISILTKALRVVGVYDSTNKEVGKILSGGEFNMIPVDDWAMFAEKGGLKGVVDWFPVEVIAKVLTELTGQRMAVVAQIFELTSISDIMRGASNPRDTLGAQKLKAQYSSVRLQLRQQDVGKFVRALIQLKCEIICLHWQPETIKRVSQIEYTESAQYADAAIALLKDYKASQYRIEVGEETLSLADYNAERELRVEYLTSVGQFLSQAGMMLESYPAALPYILKMVAWVTSAFRGSSDIETVLDQAMQDAVKNPPKPKQEGDGGADAAAKVQIATIDAQVEQGKAQAEGNARMMESAAEDKRLMAEISNKREIELRKIESAEKISREDNQTKFAIEQLKLGIADKKLALEALGIQAEVEMADADREQAGEVASLNAEVKLEESEANRAHASEQADAEREHSGEQADADRELAEKTAKSKGDEE